MKFILLLFLTGFSSILHSQHLRLLGDQNYTGKILGEVIDGPANVRSGAKGKLKFVVNDGMVVQTAPFDSNNVTIGIRAKVLNGNTNKFKLFPSQNLIDEDGRIIGKVIDTVDFDGIMEGFGLITGQTHIDNIDSLSVSETILGRLLLKGDISRPKLLAFIFTFDMDEEKYDTGFLHYLLYESDIEDPSPSDRIRLMFKKDILIAIVHSRPILTPGYRQFLLKNNYFLSVKNTLSEQDVNNLVEDRNHFFDSVD